jgi:guanylate kinase
LAAGTPSVETGRVIVISGPSGVGKGTVVRELLERRPDLVYSVSCTTRPPRPGEVHGRDYRFIDAGTFGRLVEEGAFLEWVEIYGHRSGTLWGPIIQELERGRDVILEIDVRGAVTVRERLPGAMLVFLVPPSEEELARRLRSRRTETEDQLKRRLSEAGGEMAAAAMFDHVVVNDDVERAAAEVAAILDADPPGESGSPGPRDASRDVRKESTAT